METEVTLIVVQVLGGAIITCGEHRIRASAARTFAMALYLAGERGRYLNRAAALTTLFGDQADANASHSFRQFVYKLRSYGFPIESRETDLRLPAESVRTDVEELIAAKRITAEQLTAIQRGVLPGLAYPELPALNEWVEGYRTRLERELQQALVKQVSAAREVGDWAATERAARACLTLDPLNEEATLALAEALAVGGSKAAAVKLLEEYSNEVGVSSADLKVAANVLRRRISERLPAPVRGTKTDLPFLGRLEEMRLLRDRLTRARGGEPQSLLIHGEPGIGKTRLTTEFASVAVLDGARTAWVAAQPHDVHRPLAAFVALVSPLLDMPGALGCSPESMRALRHLTGEDRTLETASEFAEWPPEARYNRTTMALRDLIDAITSECLLVLIIEDGHWLDPSSLQLLGSLAAQRTERRLLTIITSRERNAVIQHVTHAGSMEMLYLPPLAPTISLELASFASTSLTGIGDAAVSERVQQTAGGNPLFIGALAKHWADPHTRFTMPHSVTSLVAYQLERLTSTALTVLHTVVLLGRYCTLSRLAECLQVSALQLGDALQDLEDRALLVRDASTIACRHWLISEAALGSTPPSKLSWLHSCIAACLERESSRQTDRAILWDAAEHWINAGEGERAFAVLRECAATAAAIGRSREACDILARAAELTAIHSQKVESLEDALAHAAVAGESMRAFDLFARMREISPVTSPSLQLFELTVRLHAGSEVAGVASQIERLVASNSSEAFAAEAAVRLIKIADQCRDEALANRAKAIRDGIRGIARESWLEFEFVYETAFGNLDNAVIAAREALAISSAKPIGRRLGPQHNIAQVLLLAGLVSDSLRLHVDTYDSGTRIGLRRMPLAAAFALAAIYRDLNSAPDYELWAGRAKSIIAEDPSIAGIELLVFESEDQLWRRDADAVLIRARELKRLAIKAGGKNIWECALAVGIAAQHLQGRRAQADLEELNLDVSRLRGIRGDDLLVQVVCEDLLLADRPSDASKLLKRYLTQIRSVRSPLWYGLRPLIDRLAATESANPPLEVISSRG